MAISEVPRMLVRAKSRPNILSRENAGMHNLINYNIGGIKETKSQRLIRGRSSCQSETELEFKDFFWQLENGYGKMMKDILKNLKDNSRVIMKEKRNSTQRATRFKALLI